jgi:hypothetical protein
MADVKVRRVHFGYFVRPAEETGTGAPRVADQLAWQARRGGHGQPLPDIPDWIDALQQLDPRMVYFAHDHSVWIP